MSVGMLTLAPAASPIEITLGVALTPWMDIAVAAPSVAADSTIEPKMGLVPVSVTRIPTGTACPAGVATVEE